MMALMPICALLTTTAAVCSARASMPAPRACAVGARSRFVARAAVRLAADADADEDEDDLFDMSALNRRISGLESGVDLYEASADGVVDESTPEEVWVLLFNAGTSNEGIYSLELDSSPAAAAEAEAEGAEVEGALDVVVGWEDEAEAQRYGQMLEAQDMPLPTATRFSTEQIVEWCAESGHLFGIVREGVTVTPPTRNAEQWSWTPNGGVDAPAREQLADEAEAAKLRELRQQLERLGVAGGGEDGDAGEPDADSSGSR